MTTETQTKTKHNSLPWSVATEERASGHAIIEDHEGFHVGYANKWAESFKDEKHKANAEFICRAVNSHYELIEALEDAISVAEGWIHGELAGTRMLGDSLSELDEARKALDKAKGEAR